LTYVVEKEETNNTHKPNKLDKAVTVLTCIREVRGSNLARRTEYFGSFCGFFYSLLENVGIVP
jgi:hypothetical protein